VKKTLVLGAEYDDGLRRTLMDCLAELGADVAARQWGLGGSQTMETTRVYVGKDLVVVESQTYVGLTLKGEARLVDRLASMVASRRTPQ
jgi:hypothetical protein